MKRCNAFPTNAARYDIVKITQINICVECKTMHGHPSGSPNTHRTDFTSKRSPDIQPHSSFPLTSGSGQSIVGQSHDDRLLKQPEVFVNIGKEIFQIKNWIAHNLPRAVISDVTSPVNFIKGRAL